MVNLSTIDGSCMTNKGLPAITVMVTLCVPAYAPCGPHRHPCQSDHLLLPETLLQHAPDRLCQQHMYIVACHFPMPQQCPRHMYASSQCNSSSQCRTSLRDESGIILHKASCKGLGVLNRLSAMVAHAASPGSDLQQHATEMVWYAPCYHDPPASLRPWSVRIQSGSCRPH